MFHPRRDPVARLAIAIACLSAIAAAQAQPPKAPEGRPLPPCLEALHVHPAPDGKRIAIDFAAVVTANDESRRRAREVDFTPIFRRNRAWLAPNFEGLKSIHFLHRQEQPSQPGERFTWRADGASMLEVIPREGEGLKEARSLAITSPEGLLHHFGPKGWSPWTYPQDKQVRLDETRDRLMGMQISFSALRWVRDPEAYEPLSVRNDPGTGAIILELKSRPRKRDSGPEIALRPHAHDLCVERCDLTIDATNHRILRETISDRDGKVVGEARFEDWADIDGERSVPRLIRLQWTGQFDAVYRFRWHPEGVWALESGESRSKAGGPSRESIVDMTINEPTPTLDAVIEQAAGAAAYFDAPRNVETEERSLHMHPFELGGSATPAIGDESPSVRFTLESAHHPWMATLVAEIDSMGEPDEHERLLILADEQGRPVGASLLRLPGRGRTRLDFGREYALGRVCHWMIASEQPAPGRPEAPGTDVKVSAIPYRPDEDLIVQIPPEVYPEPLQTGVKLRSIRFAANDRGELTAKVELPGLANLRGLTSTITIVLLDGEDRPIAVASGHKHSSIEQDPHFDPDLALNFGPLGGRKPRYILVDFQAVQAKYGYTSTLIQVLPPEVPLFPIERMLSSPDEAVQSIGIAVLDERAVKAADLRPSGAGWEGDREIERQRQPRVQGALGPYLDRLEALLATTESPESKAAICRLLGYSQETRYAKLLRPLLDDPDPTIREGAAIGLGLLRDPESAPRLEAFRKW